MAELLSEDAIAQLLAILDEAFDKPPGEWHHFTDASPDSGYFATLAKLSPVEANQVVAGTSVAAQVSHVSFVLETATSLLRGTSEPPRLAEWQDSWETAKLDDLTWQQLQRELRGTFGGFRDSIQSHASSNHKAFGSAIGTIAHTAYHLGSIKQKIAVLKGAG